ncbi:MAG: putative zinc-binding metallopeptidase, partial [Polaromonas sp.]|nr:putative zinc-binding metallopeptidase [Polaromonas sp.]
LTTLLNEMSRSMGQPDFYPFVLPREVVAKLHFIHLVVTSVAVLGAGVDAAPLVTHAQEQLQDMVQGDNFQWPGYQMQGQSSF